MGLLHELLKKSIESYEEVLQRATLLELSLMQEDAEQTGVLSLQLEEAQEGARELDSQLLSVLSAPGVEKPSHELCQERNRVLEKVLAKQQQILAAAKVKKALVAGDLESLRAGRTGLAGYHAQMSSASARFHTTY